MRHRPLHLIAALLYALALAAPGAVRAAGDGVDHVTLMEGQLAPGAERTYRLAFAEGDLRKGWLFALVGQIHSGVAALTLLGPDGQPAGQWRWEPTAKPRWEGMALPADGAYRLSVASVGAAELSYTLYYDQSCFCSGKKLPLAGGVVIFQASAAPGTRLQSWLATDKGVDIGVTLAVRSAPAGRWPDDYRVLPAAPQEDTRAGDSYRQQSLTFTADTPDPYYLIVQGRAGTGTISFVAEEAAASEPARGAALLARVNPFLALAAFALVAALVATIAGLLRQRRARA